jgi:hypothetical protein
MPNTGDKSVLLAQEMIPGEVFGKVSLKSYFYLLDGYIFVFVE